MTRGGGLNGYDSVAARSIAVDPVFEASRPGTVEQGLHGALEPVAWSGYGGSVALLALTGNALTLGLLRVSPGEGPQPLPLEHKQLAANLPESLLGELVAPPLAGRIGTFLVSTTQVLIFVADDSHLPQSGAKLTWSAADHGERICAAAIGADGDIFIATVTGDEQCLTVRHADGTPLATISGLGAAPGTGVGLAIQQARDGRAASDDLIVYAWAEGRLARQHAADAASLEFFPLPGLEAPALTWDDRRDSAIPWHGWRCAAVGVYPVETNIGDRAAVSGLVLRGANPRLVPYTHGRHRAIVAESSERYLLVEPNRLRVVDPHTGHIIAQGHESVSEDTVFAGSGSGGFICLTPQADGEIVLRGFGIRGADIVEGFRTTLRNPSSPARRGTAQPKRPVPGLAPVETDEGLLVGLEEGAGDDTRLTLWHGTLSGGSLQ